MSAADTVKRIRRSRRVVGTIKVQAHERYVFSTVSRGSQRLVTLWEASRTLRRAVDLHELAGGRLTKEDKECMQDILGSLARLRPQRK